ncbi:MAG: hypothetical protein JXA69_00305 [Phycisphaerae bacterium]|nr:hypothetical protein [Phycisphaerae bacterium]
MIRLKIHAVALCFQGVLTVLAMWGILAAPTRAAEEIRAHAVPAPYVAVKATPTQFESLGRETRLGGMLLPEQIGAAGRPVLAAPVRIVAEPAGLDGLDGSGRVVENDGNAARWEWTGESSGFRVRSVMTGECDGFCWYEITLTPRQPLTLKSLRLEIPRVADTARYLHTSSFTWGRLSQGLPEYGGRWVDAFMPYIWLGDEERGLAWCAESDEGFRLTEATHALSVTTEGDVVRFAVTLLDHEATVDSAIVLQFGLQATPVKPVSFAWRAKARILHNIRYDVAVPDANGHVPLDAMRDAGVRTVVFHDEWTDYFGRVTTPHDKELRQLIRACHERGIKLLVYMGYGLARNAPEMKGHHDAWSTMPLIPWNPTYRPEFRGFDATCARSGWSDWLVNGIDKLFSEYELDGLYFDGTTEAWRCQNTSHGCGWTDDDGNVHTTYPVLAARRMMRRIADTVHRHRPDSILDAHMSGNLTMPTLSFCDSYWDGEQFEYHTKAEKFEIPLHAFRTEFMGYAHGLDAEFLCYVDRPFAFNEAIALAWLHGVEVRPYPETLELVSPIWKALDAFGITTAQWQPYWKGSGAEARAESIKASAWVKDGKALLFVSHLKRTPVEAVLHLDRAKLGIGPGTLAARDAITAVALPVTGDDLAVKFDGMEYQLVEVRGQE